MSLIRLEPAYQNYVWGGKRIPSYFQRILPAAQYAESWEVSDRIEGMAIIGNGPFKGKTFREWLLIEKERGVGLGKSWEKFPLLVKIIDSAEALSVQVHPDEKTAAQLGGEAKSEAWIALEKSSVYVGLKSGITREKFIQEKETNKIGDLLNHIVLEKGEAIYIPAGQIHAICANAFLLEIQQNSNTTYRLYDWERKGRELHWEKGLIATNWSNRNPLKTKPRAMYADHNYSREEILSTRYFTVQKLKVEKELQLQPNPKTCHILFCLEGNSYIENEKILPGTTYFMPATTKSISIQGPSQWLSIHL